MPRIRVAVRIKPENASDSLQFRKKKGLTTEGNEASDSIELTVEGQRYDFGYDRVFEGDTEQDKVFEECAVPISDEVIEGYNGCIFAYGQTGAGKTYTMSGPSTNEYSQRGLVSRTIAYLFERARQLSSTYGDSISLRLSVLEIYNEVLIDLLRADSPTTIGGGVTYSSSMAPSRQQVSSASTPSAGAGRASSAAAAHPPTTNAAQSSVDAVGKLNIVDTPTGVMIPSLFVMPLSNEEEASSLILEAYSNRVVAEHQLNKRSSRSHVIYTLYVTRTRVSASNSNNANSSFEPQPEVSQSKLHLVDLAGSERVVKTGSSGVVQKEATYINKSLSFLEQVVLALTQAQRTKREHIPYRQSKLTFILKDSLGGNSNTYMIACVWPHAKHSWESLSTLRFASRMSTIENTPIRNSLIDGYNNSNNNNNGNGYYMKYEQQQLNLRLKSEIDLLKRELVMRDTIAGNEPWLPQLTAKQRATVSQHVFDIVSAAPSVSTASSSSTGATTAVDGSAASTSASAAALLTVQSLSHVRLLVDSMKELVWEACDNDSQRVQSLLRRVLPTVAAEGLPQHHQQVQSAKARLSVATGGLADGGYSFPNSPLVRSKSESSPNKLTLQSQSAGKQSATRSKQQHSQQQRSGNTSSKSNNIDGSSVSMKINFDIANEKLPTTAAIGAGGAAVRATAGADRWDAMVGNLTIDTPLKLQQQGEANIASPTGNLFNNSDDNRTNSATGAADMVVMSFDEFKSSEKGIELHNAYEECKQTLRNNKQHQKELVAMINNIKANIDKLSIQLSGIKDSILQVNYKLQNQLEFENQSAENSNKSPDGTESQQQQQDDEQISSSNIDTVQRMQSALETNKQELQALQTQMLVLEAMEAEAKKEYRSAHAELQLTKTQAHELQALKQRAMAALVHAYDTECQQLHNQLQQEMQPAGDLDCEGYF